MPAFTYRWIDGNRLWYFSNNSALYVQYPGFSRTSEDAGLPSNVAWRSRNSIILTSSRTLRVPFLQFLALVSAYETNRTSGLNKASRSLSFCAGHADLNVSDRQLLQKIERQGSGYVSFLAPGYVIYCCPA